MACAPSLESVSRSPVYADFSQMLTGLISIRAFRKQTVKQPFVEYIPYTDTSYNHAGLLRQHAAQP